jgi:hypothetical protein
MRKLHKPVALMFLAALMTPATVQFLSDRTTVSVAEKRTLEPMPAWPRRWGEWSDFPGGLDRFLRDHFGLREPLATGWSLFKYALRHTPRVAIGREGWLYFPQYWGPKYGARTCGSLSEALLSFADRLDRLAAYAAANEVPMVFAVAPDKETLYPEYMPEKPDTRSHCDLFAELGVALQGKRHLKTVDLRAALESGKARERVYFKTDSHWNDVGSRRVAAALLEGSCDSRSACPKLPEPSLSTKTTSGDLAAFIGLGSVLTEQTVAVELPGAKRAGRMLTLVGDSFAKTLPRFLAADGSVASVRFQDHAMGRIDLRRIVAAKPDAILIVIVERYLYDPELLRSFAAGF